MHNSSQDQKLIAHYASARGISNHGNSTFIKRIINYVPDYFSGLSRATFPTTFLEIAVIAASCRFSLICDDDSSGLIGEFSTILQLLLLRMELILWTELPSIFTVEYFG